MQAQGVSERNVAANGAGVVFPDAAAQGSAPEAMPAALPEQSRSRTKRPSARAEAEQLRAEMAEMRETVLDLSAALSNALDENSRLRRLLPPPSTPRARSRAPLMRIRSR